MRVIAFDELAALAGSHVGRSEWHAVEQNEINLFAAATGDDQWIHVDAARARAGPYGTTIAHGYLTLSLLPVLMRQVVRVEGTSLGLNYGLDRVRFITPVRCGDRVRAAVDLLTVDSVSGGVQAAYRVTVELESGDKPACVAEPIVRYLR
jgi:acyl dehydratase